MDALEPLARGWWRPFVTPAVRYVAEIGPPARPAEPVLTAALRSGRRPRGLHGGWRTIAEDLELGRLSAAAVAAVQHPGQSSANA